MSIIMDARNLAMRAHAGQYDKAGRDYIDHPARVAARVVHREAQAVAWLHDTVEDTDVTLVELYRLGFPGDVVDAVDALTRRPDEDDSYYVRVRANPIALQVKLADIADNTDPRRLVHLDDVTVCRLIRKYAKALRILTGEITP